MRIRHILPYDLKQPGGVQTHTLALSDALTTLGHDSQVLAPSHPFRVPLGDTRADLSLHPIDLLALRRFLNHPHDILHIQEPMLPLLGPLALLHPSSAAVVITLHSAESLAARAYKWTRPLSRALLRRADAVICASEVSRGIASDVLPHDPTMIFPCLDLEPFRNVVRQPEPNTLLFVGRDEPRKGLHVLLDAMPGIWRHLPNARLIVAGPVSPQTRATTDDRVTFLGPVPHSDLPALMSRATCAVFPALGGEALGLVVIEAMAAGLPVIASDIDGYRIASDGGHAALLSPPGDAQTLSQHIARLCTEVELQETLVARGKASAERFDAVPIAEQHLDLYQSLRNT